MMILITLWAVYAQTLGEWMRARTERREHVVWEACVYPGGKDDVQGYLGN